MARPPRSTWRASSQTPRRTEMRHRLKDAILPLLLILVLTVTPHAEGMTVKAVMRRGVDYLTYDITVNINYA